MTGLVFEDQRERCTKARLGRRAAGRRKHGGGDRFADSSLDQQERRQCGRRLGSRGIEAARGRAEIIGRHVGTELRREGPADLGVNDFIANDAGDCAEQGQRQRQSRQPRADRREHRRGAALLDRTHRPRRSGSREQPGRRGAPRCPGAASLMEALRESVRGRSVPRPSRHIDGREAASRAQSRARGDET